MTQRPNQARTANQLALGVSRALVDCLYTIDAAAGVSFSSGTGTDRRIPTNVTLNVNYYQTDFGPALSTHSYGGRNSAVDPHQTRIVEENFTGRVSHDRMDDVTNARVAAHMQQLLQA